MPIYELHPTIYTFPDPQLAEEGMPLAVGGDLTVERLLKAYESGIFPWYAEGEPLMWWSPDPRMVLYPAEIVIHKSMRPVLRNKGFSVTVNEDFARVIRACSQVPRPGQEGTWITDEMIASYEQLHQMGHAHSLEVWQGGQIVGGLYGVTVRKVFAGESMYSLVSNASKVALIALADLLKQTGYEMIDCQFYTRHLAAMGAREISREAYLGILKKSPAGNDRGLWNNVAELSAADLL
jgi:leucyl/phenylalanyl-tRNA--protein transferase